MGTCGVAIYRPDRVISRGSRAPCCATHARKHVAVAEKSLATDKTRDVVDVPELEDRMLPTNGSCVVHIGLQRSWKVADIIRRVEDRCSIRRD